MEFNAQKNASAKRCARRPRPSESAPPASAARVAVGPRPPGCAPVTPAWSAALPTSPLYGVEAALDADNDPVILHHVNAINAITGASAGPGAAPRNLTAQDIAVLITHQEALLAHVQQKRQTLESWTLGVATVETAFALTDCLNQLLLQERTSRQSIERSRQALAARQRQRGRV
ncbi:hypothetical protein H9P43_006791 [Blastocladiella emersonii ATCC 22665]|nr:hypothetical protein H9P43_006791 [Blastocladiella emersonii ATCC 22665]